MNETRVPFTMLLRALSAVLRLRNVGGCRHTARSLRPGERDGAGPDTGTVLRQALVSGRVRMRARRVLLHGLLALLVATGASGMGAYAQTPPADGVRMPVTLPDSAVWRIRSEGSGLEYQIMVAWPD